MLPHSWRRLLSLVRVLLALSCLIIQLTFSASLCADSVILFAAFTLYACAALLWRSLEESGYATLALILDFVFFFLSAVSSAGYTSWISPVFYAYVLLAAVML